jgi:hypothetical protein
MVTKSASSVNGKVPSCISGTRVVGEMPSGGEAVVVDWETAEIHNL